MKKQLQSIKEEKLHNLQNSNSDSDNFFFYIRRIKRF
ncbi:MAG: hypothetical protein J0H12_01870 [Candidatus Paracaedimonas acanthamoebae]|uniref:Uncharacterized protein n=1 Tax=Candidatus Paracaedimonas acanthamoebae TaxID=244581 RepID=A0A8J7TT99_9PROT|nr:hypothetical protein [Candidatus Paracaedimonas acanthamoebae]